MIPIYLHNIPCLLQKPEGKHKPTTVFLFHGWGSSTENQGFLASILAKWGYQVIIPEIIYHNSRSPLSSHFQSDIMEGHFWPVILHSINEVPIMLKDANNQGIIQNQQIVLAGSSMGGFIATGAFVQETGAHALVNINGSGSWLKSEKEFQKAGSRPALCLDKLIQQDPILHVKKLDNRPILLMHGSDDCIIKPAGQRDFHKKALAAGHENITLEMFPNINHTISLTMIELLLRWMDEQL
ncbi:dienelactone hydrolase family protein [Peribacillus deserti]|uniref:Phospholipase n=1 Tax=Peribacillus deserti TaxID=673318 RepID=A0A2N5M586_9BACI|nr:dienelactone hydrolase family protein [Peribacillus deserti]PLT29519.1 phospholipase [Peribacillus deserti]